MATRRAPAAMAAPTLAPPSSPADAAYRVMLEVLADRPSFRKTDLQSAIKASVSAGGAAGAAGATGAARAGATTAGGGGDASSLSEAQLARVVKVLCRSRGNQWCLKDVN